MSSRYAVIMAGGTGERFWPLSRKLKPKHLHPIVGDVSMLEQTFMRLSGCIPQENIFILTSAQQRPAMLEVCPFLKPSQVVAEPCPRDTCAAVALATKLVKRFDKDAVFGVFPADQFIDGDEAFAKNLECAFDLACRKDGLFTIGIKPTYPATGYGYIELAESFDDAAVKYYKAARFVEKPNLARAKEYLEKGGFLWNAGMFVWTVKSIESALYAHAADVYKPFEVLEGAGHAFFEKLDAFFPDLKKISIDFAVMERASNVYCVPSLFEWDDVGSWSALERHGNADAAGNLAAGLAEFVDACANTVYDKTGRFTAVIGLNNIVVAHTADATLVCAKDRLEDIKQLVKKLPEAYK